MKIEDFRLLQRGIEQIQDGDPYGREFVTQSQTCQPEGGKCAGRYNQGLQDKQCFRAGNDQIKQRNQEKNRFKMDGKARNTIHTRTVGIADDIAYRLMKELPVCQTPDGLVHRAQVFSGREIGILSPKMQKNKIYGKGDCDQRDQTGRHPEEASARQGFGYGIEI